MKRHITTLFKINNLHKLKFPFKLMQLELQEIENDPALNNRNIQKVLMKLASETSGPVALYYKDEKKFIAVKADTSITSKELHLSPMIAKVSLLDEIYELNFDALTKENRELAIRFLEFSIKEHVGNHPKLWRYSSSQYFLRKPIFQEPYSNIDVYSGFTFKVVSQPDGNFYVSLDLSYKYADKKFLHEHLIDGDISILKKRLKGKRCLYFGGDSWYPVQIADFGKAIKEQEFSVNGQKHTVYNWALNKTKSETFNMSKHLFPDSPSLIFNYPGNTSKYFNGAACLAKFLFSTSDNFVNGMHAKTIQVPSSRFHYLKGFIKHNFQSINFNGIQLDISQYPLKENLKVFPLPGLKFNKGQEYKAIPISERYESLIDGFGKARRVNIIRNGILNNSQFGPQYLLIPDTVDILLAKTIQSYFEKDLKMIAPSFDKFDALIIYKDLKGTSALRQYNEIKETLQKHNATQGSALFLLPEVDDAAASYIRNLHDCVKKKFHKDIRFQCASVTKVSSFFKSFASKDSGYEYKIAQEKLMSYRSYTYNLFFEYLIVNQKWPYALSTALNHDIYIGLDVHDHYAGFVFFYKNGEKIVFDYKEVSDRTGTFRNEKISAKVIIEILLSNLKRHIPAHAVNPNSIVLLRDGRSFGEEGKALRAVLDELAKEGLVDRQRLKWGIVDVHKHTTIPYRVAIDNEGYNGLSNPWSGTYKLFDDKSGFLFSTGYPFKIQGTVQPLHVSLIEGDVHFETVMQDIFHQCILAFSAPDKGASLPVVLKLIDTMIRPFAHQVTEKLLEEHEETLQLN
jgi:hypothetical protein